MEQNKKNVLVIGMGKSGIAAAEALLAAGHTVTVYDKKNREDLPSGLAASLEGKGAIPCFGHDPEAPEQFDQVIMSPGVPVELPFVQAAKAGGAEIIGELELAYRMGKGNYAAITGTNGKTTTTALTGEIFKAAGRKTEVVGNIGVAVVTKALEADEDTWLVTECSSFQLDTTETFRPHVSALLNLTPDHLDRHKTFQNYADAKGKIFASQTAEDYFVVNADDAPSMEQAAKCKATVVPFSRKQELDFGCFVQDGNVVIRTKNETAIICEAKDIYIPGNHNLENALAASAVAYFAGIEPAVIAETLKTFRGVEHRMEYAGSVKGVRFVNDSKGTNPDAAIKALEAIKGGILLIAGGYDKGSTYEEFIAAFGGKVKALLLMGKTAPKIKETAEKAGFSPIYMLKDMEECTRTALELAEEGDTVLLSPACASWDMYSCFEERGEDFKNRAKALGAVL